MSEAWKQWEGRVVDGKFPLRQYLGGSEHSAVFLTERSDPPQKAAIKFIQVDASAAELQLSRWKRIAQLSHPHLLRLFECGRCRIGDFNLLFVVMEHANENLGEFLPQRPLTPAETRDVLVPALEGLGYAHRENFVHGHIQPSNILAIDDQLKLSSDTLSPVSAPKADEKDGAPKVAAGEDPAAEGGGVIGSSATLRRPSPHCAPEAVKGVASTQSDIWSLGVTIIEALTQRAPALDNSSRRDPELPETLPSLFLEIVRNCLRRDPQARWTVAQIQQRLNPNAAPQPAQTTPATQTVPVVRAAATSPSVAPPVSGIAASLPEPRTPAPPPPPSAAPLVPPVGPLPGILSPVPAARAANTTAVAAATARVSPAPRPAPAKPAPSKNEPYHIPAARPPMQAAVRNDARHHEIALPKLKQPPLLPKMNYFLMGTALGLVIIGLIGIRIFSHRGPATQQTASVTPAQPVAPQKSAPPPPAGKGKSQPPQSKSAASQKLSASAAASNAPSPQPPPKSAPKPAAQATPQNALKASPEKQPPSASAVAASSRSDAITASTAAPVETTLVAAAASGHVVHGEVLNQVLPEVSDKARSTIWGTVRVGVKVHVDTAGNVIGAELNSPGPSKFFADKALEAARSWDFVPAKLDGHNVASDWIIRFQFTHSDTKVFPAEETP